MMLFVLTGQKVTDFNFSRLPLHNMRPNNSNMKVLMLQNVSCPQTKQDGFDERFSILFMYCFFFVDSIVIIADFSTLMFPNAIKAQPDIRLLYLQRYFVNAKFLMSKRKYAFAMSTALR